MQNFIDIAKVFLEEKFSTQFSIKELNQIETKNSIGDLAVNLILRINDTEQNIYYFMDRKFAKNLLKAVILELNDFDLNSDFTEKAIFEFNNQIIKKLNQNNLETEFLEQNIIKDYQSELDDQSIRFSVTSLHSDQGDFLLGFSKESPKKRNNYSQPKKTSANVFNSSSILQVKEKSDDSSAANTIISTVQLLEIKKQVLTSLSEIKDLRGDAEFLLRKAKAVTDLSKLWFDILKEEN